MVSCTLVTVHGLWSSPATWERLNAAWYADKQLRGLLIAPFSYPSPGKPSLPLSRTRVPDYDDIAQTFATWYTVQLADDPDVAIVTHSQGGLILQRFLARMLHEGRGRELARIRSIVMLACPNTGSDYLRSVRGLLRFGSHAQAGSLRVFDKQVADTQRTVIEHIVNATGVNNHQCRIPFHVYAGNSDKIVVTASAHGAFPNTSVLPGNHSSILDSTAPGNCTAETVRHHLIADLATNPVRDIPSPAGTDSFSSGALLTKAEETAEKAMVNIVDGNGALASGDAEVQEAQEQQAARDLAAMRDRQDEIGRQLTQLSEQARQLEAFTAQRIDSATATIMNDARKANRQFSAQTQQMLDQQAQQWEDALKTERAERQRELDALRTKIERDRPSATSTFDSAQRALTDARLLRDAIRSSLPHERFAPGVLGRLSERLTIAEANLESGISEAALAQAQEMFVSLGELREKVALKDAEWRAAHLTAGSAVLILSEQIERNSLITVADEESGTSAELDVDFWSDGELAAIKAEAESLAARMDAEVGLPSVAELRHISEESAISLTERLSRTVTTAQARQRASQVRVNVAEIVIDALEETTGYFWDGEAAFIGSDQRAAFYSKLKHLDGSEIVIEVAPGEENTDFAVRVMSYDTGDLDGVLRVARIRAITDSLWEHGLTGAHADEVDKPDPAFRDFEQVRQRRTLPPAPPASEQA